MDARDKRIKAKEELLSRKEKFRDSFNDQLKELEATNGTKQQIQRIKVKLNEAECSVRQVKLQLAKMKNSK